MPAGKDLDPQFTPERCQIEDELKDIMDAAKQDRLRKLLKELLKKTLYTFREASHQHGMMSATLADAIVSTEERHIHSLDYAFVISCCSVILEWTPMIWNEVERRKSTDDIWIKMFYLGLSLKEHEENHRMGRYCLKPWATIEKYRKAEEGPPSSGEWALDPQTSSEETEVEALSCSGSR
ncbi:hypothetical protein PV08_09001 [Exophiala spinifera]|uniref:Uncharacterized protein n=1 Tax=Exophiala spinifera TaxID=91928 RepID=A0A0D2BRC2_9EURO|nr:uncharacterized protein PV08_12086 [Exophiala spinifera]XP_016234025.1 uncharacterized protein PV08_09001 [Exophiala spinifera]KIW09671.1 hypothetical protein PV08_12086 [Exophiala spinifera]KIW13809.1 hypothetical protein PV08_09001 [Exophiala spinifera]